MINQEAKKLLDKILLRQGKKQRLLSAWLSLFVGCLLLLLSVMIWSVFQDVMNGKGKQSDRLGSSFLTLSKIVDDAAMSNHQRNVITEQDLAKIKTAPQVQDAGLLIPANFKVAASMGAGNASFYTLLFLEAAPDKFMDQMPHQWQWQEGDAVLPIILSRDFLNMYNYLFAPSQGLPLLSEQSVKAIGFNITVGEGMQARQFRAQVEGFSDRISSVLVPLSFIEYGNQHFAAGSTTQNASRAIVQVADPSQKDFVDFLHQNQYSTNAEQLRYSKMRAVVQVFSSATVILSVLLMLIGALVFILFIELTLAKAQSAVQLLMQLGYSPNQLAQFMRRKYLPLLLSAIATALVVSVGVQYLLAAQLAQLSLSVATIPAAIVWLVAAISAALLSLQTSVSIARAIRR